ncbi:hypothetical protein D3C78_1709380 [compost metagenome]
MIVQRTFNLTTATRQSTDFRFGIGVKRHRQMGTNKTAECLMRTLGFLYVE